MLDLNNAALDREGAFLQPQPGGDRLNIENIDRIALTVHRKSSAPARWAMTGYDPIRVSPGKVPKLEKPVLPKGRLLDEMGQRKLHDWPSKTHSVEIMKRRIQNQLEEAPKHSWPAEFSRWGGWKQKRIAKGSTFFRTHHDGKRWWLVDPDGYAYWSAGIDCVGMENSQTRYDGVEAALTWIPSQPAQRRGNGAKYVNYLEENLMAALGREGWRDQWARITLGEMRRLRFNTVGNWSDFHYASAAAFPYVRPLNFRGARTPMIYRDFPDVYHPDFAKDAADYARPLESTKNDPALIGYFLMNEPGWHSASELPATGMLYNTESCATRVSLSAFLKKKYTGDAGISAAWQMPVSFDEIVKGKWQGAITPEGLNDLREFSVVMVNLYFETLCGATRRVDPNHLILGMRWAYAPPEWALRGMKHFDVFSTNFYGPRLPFDLSEKINKALRMPVMVGEWHVGALDRGLPTPGLCHVRDQAARGKGYRFYLEDAAANPYCVGAHWFTLYDESALGRFDGENFNSGFFDICNQPYEELAAAAIASHEQLYRVAAGEVKPFNDPPEYLPDLYI